MTTLWPIVVFALKLLLVGAMALMLAVRLWILDHALRNGAVFEHKPGRIRTRAQTPPRYWFYIAYQILFVAATVVMIHVVIRLGDRYELPETNMPEERQVRPNDESYDRANVDFLVRGQVDVSLPGEASVKARCLRAQHLVATALSLGRLKDYARVEDSVDQGALDFQALKEVLRRHSLTGRWQEFLAKAGKADPLV